MKKFLIYFFLSLISINLYYSQTFSWTRFIPVGPYPEVCGIISDDSSNCYALYNFGAPATEKSKAFLLKINAAGKTVWQKQDTSGMFKALAKSPTHLYAGGKDYLAKYDINGKLTWKKAMRIDDIIYYKSHLFATVDNYFFKLDTAGNIVWSKSLNLYGVMHVKPGDEDFLYVEAGSGGANPYYIYKFDILGNLVWSKKVPGMYLKEMSTDEVGNVYLTGQFGGSAVFDDISLKCTECSYAENYYLARLNNNGVWDWARQIENTSGEAIYSPYYSEYIFTGEIKASGYDSANAFLGVYKRMTGRYEKGIRFPVKGYNEIGKLASAGNSVFIAGSRLGNDPRIFIAKVDDNTLLKSEMVEEPESMDYQLRVFPNPTEGVFQIVYSAKESGKLLLTITDPEGGLFYTENISRFQGEFKRSIDLRNSIKGVYIVEVVNDKQKQVERLVYN
ncbi:MAG: T9SS type A sorting domain-containing protein [Bacteroidia bacterium]